MNDVAFEIWFCLLYFFALSISVRASIYLVVFVSVTCPHPPLLVCYPILSFCYPSLLTWIYSNVLLHSAILYIFNLQVIPTCQPYYTCHSLSSCHICNPCQPCNPCHPFNPCHIFNPWHSYLSCHSSYLCNSYHTSHPYHPCHPLSPIIHVIHVFRTGWDGYKQDACSRSLSKIFTGKLKTTLYRVFIKYCVFFRRC